MNKASERFKMGKAMAERLKQTNDQEIPHITVAGRTEFDKKMSRLERMVAQMGRGWKVIQDDKVKFCFRILDANGKDLTGPKTLDAALEWIEEQKS